MTLKQIANFILLYDYYRRDKDENRGRLASVVVAYRNCR